MRILVIAPQPFLVDRGTPIAVRALVEELGRAGHTVDLVTLHLGEDVVADGLSIHRIRRPRFVNSVPIGPSWQKLACAGAILARAQRLLRARQYDFIHGVEDGAFLAAVLSMRFGVPFVYDMDSHLSAQVRERSRFLAPAAWCVAAAERWMVRRAAGVLAVCPALVKVAQSLGATGPVELLPDMPLMTGQCGPSEEIAAVGGRRIVYVGNLERYQGLDLLLDAFRLMSADHADARLIVVGGAEPQLTRFRQRMSTADHGDRVSFLGARPLSDLGGILAAADILVSPRLQGVNTPMKIYSYLESGRPVVATRLPTHTQVLNDEVAMLVAPDARALAGALGRLLCDDALRDALGMRGQAFVRGTFGREAFALRLQSFYAGLTGNGGTQDRMHHRLAV